jgi:HTH-type transcriptional regulator/antitoxin HigA
MVIKIIKTEQEYNEAIERVEQIFDALAGTPEADELELLAMLIDNYEEQKYPIPFPHPLEAIKFRMEQLGIKNKDLADIIGYKSRVSEILNNKRKLSLDMIRKISAQLHISSDLLILKY